MNLTSTQLPQTTPCHLPGLAPKLLLYSSITVAALLGNPSSALAHGVFIESEPVQSLQMRALYESGEPMTNAQVTIYAPSDPETPWKQITTDEKGTFLFTPDPAIPGDWDVQVRKAGHGDLVRVTVGETADGSAIAYANQSSQDAGQSPVQKWVTIVATVWGFVGTALFFSQRQSTPSSGP